MIPTDPKEAAELGKKWGETITDSVFGFSFRNTKHFHFFCFSK